MDPFKSGRVDSPMIFQRLSSLVSTHFTLGFPTLLFVPGLVLTFTGSSEFALNVTVFSGSSLYYSLFPFTMPYSHFLWLIPTYCGLYGLFPLVAYILPTRILVFQTTQPALNLQLKRFPPNYYDFFLITMASSQLVWLNPNYCGLFPITIA